MPAAGRIACRETSEAPGDPARSSRSLESGRWSRVRAPACRVHPRVAGLPRSACRVQARAGRSEKDRLFRCRSSASSIGVGALNSAR